jgi:NAD(P)-dependent dehydrogenase (short-subunit alcohol dehydrogenase family)
MELEGRAAIVTGSARGIGAGIAAAFGREGANVVVNGLPGESCQETIRRVAAGGGNAIAAAADVADAAQVQRMVAAAIDAFGGVDILVNNADIESPPRLLHEMSEQQWDRALAVNLKGVFLCCRAVLPAMLARGKGKIINIASTAGRRMTFVGGADYTASKHAVSGLTQHLAWEVADRRINVNEICRLVPPGRFCRLEDLAQAAIFLASDKSDMITGQLLAVDGGFLGPCADQDGSARTTTCLMPCGT